MSPVIGAGCSTAAIAGLVLPLVLAVVLFSAVAGGSTAIAEGVALDGVPAPFRDAVLAAAQGCPGLPAHVLAAQLEQESGFDQQAVSPAGAQGLAQFMPATWAAWGRDADGDGTASPFDATDAIDAQGRLMCSLLRTAAGTGWGDPLDLALAGYNAGWGAVVAHRGIPPYRETQDYVSAIRDAAIRFVGPGAATLPVPDPDPITNGFGNRPPGISYALGYHTGVDFNADRRSGNDYGQLVLAARAGTVVRAGWGGPLGNELVIAHGDGLYSSYGHMAGFAAGIRLGLPVAAGQRVGAIGCSGMSRCAPHLHFEVRRTPDWRPGTFVDPLVWLGVR